MEPYICITQLNDFIFCPRSIYFHNIYQDNFCADTYHKTWQKNGQSAHKSVDEGAYSTRKDIIQAMPVFSRKYNISGVIDILDVRQGILTERKYSVTQIYDGFRYQVYAQYFALCEMGYQVNHMKIYSKKSNKSYSIKLPDEDEIKEFESVIDRMNNFSLDAPFTQTSRKCVNCVYNMLCDIYQEVE